MSGHYRFWVAAFLLFAGLSTSPASSNPFEALFNSAPKEATAPASAEEECLLQPGKSTAQGQHWVYRLDGHRKCWFQAAEGTVSVKKQVQHRTKKQIVGAPDENEAGLRQKAVVDARAQLLGPAPADAFRPIPPAPELVDPAPVPVNGAATLVPPAPVIAEPPVNQLAPDRPTPRPVDVEILLATVPLASDTGAPMPPATPNALSIPDAGEEWEWIATQVGVVLIALGLVSLLGSLMARGLAEAPTLTQTE